MKTRIVGVFGTTDQNLCERLVGETLFPTSATKADVCSMCGHNHTSHHACERAVQAPKNPQKIRILLGRHTRR